MKPRQSSGNFDGTIYGEVDGKPNRICTPYQFAELRYTHLDMLVHYAHIGKLQGTKLGKSWVFRGQYLIDFIDA